MTDLQNDPTVRHPRGPLAWVGGLAVVGVIAIAVIAALGYGFGAAPSNPVAVVPSPVVTAAPSAAPAETAAPAAGGGAASCIRYDPTIVPTFDAAFDGTVTAIDGDSVTFKVNKGWKGATGEITLTKPEAIVGLLGPLPDFKVGGRYLVTASDSTIGTCGY